MCIYTGAPNLQTLSKRFFLLLVTGSHLLQKQFSPMEAFLGELSLFLIAIILRLSRDIIADNAYILNIQLYVFWSTYLSYNPKVGNYTNRNIMETTNLVDIWNIIT